MILQGKNLIIVVNSSVIAAAKSCTLNVDCEKIKVSSPTDGQWEHVIAGMKSWSISTSHLVKADTASDTPIRDAVARVGQTYTIRVQVNGLTHDLLTGSALCHTFQVTAINGNLMQGSFKFTGSGPLA
jgi:predicted secreted protein